MYKDIRHSDKPTILLSTQLFYINVLNGMWFPDTRHRTNRYYIFHIELCRDIRHSDKPTFPLEYSISTYKYFQCHTTPRHPTNRLYKVILSISISFERYPAYRQTLRHYNILYISNYIQRYPALQKKRLFFLTLNYLQTDIIFSISNSIIWYTCFKWYTIFFYINENKISDREALVG